jgi:ribosomal-protein-serine acetyltransferase
VDPILSISPDLFLRVLRPYEAGALFSLIQENRSHLREWLPWIDATRSPVDSRRFLEMSYSGFLRGAGFNFGIRYYGGLIGVIGFHGFDRANRTTSIGYWLSQAMCGKGIMRQSVGACIQYAFEKQGMNRLYIRCATGNQRSRRVAEALGFTHEGTQREAEWLYDHFVDLEVYSILASEWKGSLTFGF